MSKNAYNKLEYENGQGERYCMTFLEARNNYFWNNSKDIRNTCLQQPNVWSALQMWQIIRVSRSEKGYECKITNAANFQLLNYDSSDFSGKDKLITLRSRGQNNFMFCNDVNEVLTGFIEKKH